MNGFIANRTFPPGFIRESKVVENTRPAKNVTTTSDLPSNRWVQTDRADHFLTATGNLKEKPINSK